MLGCYPLTAAATTDISALQFDNYSVAEGLTQSTVIDIIEDKQGFIWVATADGLNRFDGYKFKQYRHNPDDPSSLPNKFVRKLFIDQKERLWVGTEKGLARYSPDSDNFRRYTSQNSNLKGGKIWTITETSEQTLWITDESHIYEYHEQSDNFSIVNLAGTEHFPEITVVKEEHNRLLLGSYGHGIRILDQIDNKLYELNGDNPWELVIPARTLLDVLKVDNQLWLATEQGVFVLDKNLKLVKSLSPLSSPSLPGYTVRTLAQGQNGDIWIGTTEGLSILTPDTNNSLTIGQNNDALVSLRSRYIFRLFVDSKGSLWLGSYSGGLHRFNENAAFIKHYESIPQSNIALSDNMVWALSESGDGNIWIATQFGGLNLFDPNTGEFTHFLKDFSHSIWDMSIDEKDRIWLATIDGVFVYQLAKDKAPVQVKHLLAGELIENINLAANKAWLSSAGTVTSISLEDFEVERVQVANSKGQLVKPDIVDSKGNVWLISNSNISLFNLETQQFNHLLTQSVQDSSPFSNANSVIEGDNYFWVSSLKSGLYKLDKETYQPVQHFNKDNGLSDNVVLTMLLDKEYLWVATFRGIDQIALRDGKIVRHISRAQLDYNELNESAGLITRNGNILFGGTNGFHVFRPERLSDSVKATDLKPTITELQILNQQVGLNDIGSPLDKPIHRTTELTLENNASPFSFGFARINPVNANSINYRYQMQGLSDQWLEADNRIRQASFTNLGFGDYVFKVQARELDGPWSEATALKIRIKSPLWLHRYALIIYALCGFLILSYWYNQYQHRRNSQKRVQDSEERLKLTLWSSGDELWDWDIPKGEVFRSNIWGIMDFPQDNQRVVTELPSNIHPSDISRVRETLAEHLQGQSEFYEITYRVKNFSGKWVWLLDRGKVVTWSADKKPLRMTGTLKNISHLKEAEEQLRLFKRSIETISDGVFITDTSFRIVSVNQAYCHHTGETKQKALASYLNFEQYPPAFTEEVRKALKQKGNWSGEIESTRHGNERYEIDLNIDAIHDENGNVSHFVGVFSDITSRKQTEKELLQLANTDTLTGLPNRSFFQASHQNLIRRTTSHALICMDMDNFKKINDSMGHQTGDLLIKQIANRLQKITGTSSTCYRLGGDEFSILIENTTDVHRITHLAQSILDDMARSFVINRQEFVLGASLGIAFYPEDGKTPQELLKNADTAMYFAKNAGGNKYQFFSGEMNQNAVRQLQIENLIRHGIKEDLFSVYYQPKVDIASGQLVSMEALVRFEHPEKGIVSPDQFIPLAEETGQIIDIGDIVLRKACEQTQEWVKKGLFTGRVAINISARQFELPDLDRRIEQVLKETGLSALHLECEITEGTLMQHPEQSLQLMQRLREMGIHLALDDFGTGYSSLAYLKRFPLNTLKIDKAFIDEIATSSVDRHMTSAIITIAHNLGLKVVAEGVEEEQQLSILRRYECEMLQGYLYSKPLSAERFTRLLIENRHLSKLIKQQNL
ncbi:EAL domain-containing protein [Lacimicrobium alkaliphilum]|uniref:cyclic-guanylate-specific phosphodiesterase n=1 Tax=Lacimicrobium alkaliphilum TaxID=1526571 RepID=A0A0U2PF59_9ALTE|nr:histidine kinase [Lacimicrobium alkaliphilum]